MLAECAQDLYTKVQGIPVLASSTGLALGGKAPDPGLTKIPLPAAWILLEQVTSTVEPSPLPAAALSGLLAFTVVLYVPYEGQSDLITNQLPLIEKVIGTIHGTTSPTGQRWRFQQTKRPGINPDRFIYPITFVVDAGSLI